MSKSNVKCLNLFILIKSVNLKKYKYEWHPQSDIIKKLTNYAFKSGKYKVSIKDMLNILFKWDC